MVSLSHKVQIVNILMQTRKENILLRRFTNVFQNNSYNTSVWYHQENVR
jgi:hypothetical protein